MSWVIPYAVKPPALAVGECQSTTEAKEQLAEGKVPNFCENCGERRKKAGDTRNPVQNMRTIQKRVRWKRFCLRKAG